MEKKVKRKENTKKKKIKKNKKNEKKQKNPDKPFSHPLHYLDYVIGIGCHLLTYFWFLIVSVLLTPNSVLLVLYISF